VIYLSPSRLSMRGGRVVTNARRDAVDVCGIARRAMPTRTAKPCGPGAPMQVPSAWKMFSRATVTTKPGLTGVSTE
jgi:hypothetical protein